MTSTRYELRILGRLSPPVRADFPGFEVSEAPVESVLLGELLDAAHLQGVLARLDAFGLQVLEMRSLPMEVPATAGSDTSAGAGPGGRPAR
jgi:hypothetical protein